MLGEDRPQFTHTQQGTATDGEVSIQENTETQQLCYQSHLSNQHNFVLGIFTILTKILTYIFTHATFCGETYISDS